MWKQKALELLLSQLPDRVIVDKRKVPREAYDVVAPVLNNLRRFEGVLEKFDPDKPNTWVPAMRMAGGELIEPPKKQIIKDPFSEFLLDKEYGALMPDCLEWLIDYVTMSRNIEFVFRHGSKIMGSIDIEGNHLYVKLAEQSEGNEEEEEGSETEIEAIWLPIDENRRATIYQTLSRLFWNDHKKIMLDRTEEEYVVSNHKFKHEGYRGEMLDVLRDLRSFPEQGHRRVVILQGNPGTGKSTLCNTVAKEFDMRTLVITNRVVQTVDRDDWELLMAVVAPELVIIDDIDRIGTRQLEQALHLFEDGYYDVPLTLMTTNDHHRLPAAFRRPGRVDFIFHMPTPTEEIQREMVEKFKQDIGVKEELPEDMKILLMHMMSQNVPGAHIKELLTRCKVYGADYEIHANDDVFSDYRQKHNMIKELIEQGDDEAIRKLLQG